MTNPIPAHFDRQILASGLDHAEGVCWDPRRRGAAIASSAFAGQSGVALFYPFQQSEMT